MTLGTKETRLTKRQTGQNGNDILAPETSFSHHHRVQLVKGQWIRLCGVVLQKLTEIGYTYKDKKERHCKYYIIFDLQIQLQKGLGVDTR